jgi:D-alanyl-D-alanine carboxypeptidase/D-alanyl-D-alanine-endopeptidase (penicillin-binding protein 4)
VDERAPFRRCWSKSAVALGLVALGVLPAHARGGDDPRTERFNAAVAKILSRKELDGATVGIELRSLTRDARVGSRNVNRAFAPASNLKLVTLYLSLQILGPEWNFQTQLVAGGPIVEGGRLEGDLWVRGGGDPTLQPAFFETEDENDTVTANLFLTEWIRLSRA